MLRLPIVLALLAACGGGGGSSVDSNFAATHTWLVGRWAGYAEVAGQRESVCAAVDTDSPSQLAFTVSAFPGDRVACLPDAQFPGIGVMTGVGSQLLVSVPAPPIPSYGRVFGTATLTATSHVVLDGVLRPTGCDPMPVHLEWVAPLPSLVQTEYSWDGGLLVIREVRR